MPRSTNAAGVSPRFSEPNPATDAGPGAYVSSTFMGKGPAHSITDKRSPACARPDTPGPGHYIDVRLDPESGEKARLEGFGNRKSPRFAVASPCEGEAERPGPGAYESQEFEGRLGKEITFGRQSRPAGWAAKIRDIAPFPWEMDDKADEVGSHGDGTRYGRFRSHARKKCNSDRSCTRTNGPRSAPLSSRFRRACARGRRLGSKIDERNTRNGGDDRRGAAHENNKKRSIADVIKDIGRQRKAHAARVVTTSAPTAGGKQRMQTGRKRALATRRNGRDHPKTTFGTATQRPRDAPLLPGPSSYHPVTRDEAARHVKVCGVGVSQSGRGELFPTPPDSPGPARYAMEVVQGPAVDEWRRRSKDDRGITTYDERPAAPHGYGALDTVAPMPSSPSKRPQTNSHGCLSPTPAGTFGSSERFPPDTARRPGVGDYDLRAADVVNVGADSTAITLGRKPAGSPYVPSLNRYLRTDDLRTPSPHAYRPETAKGGGGEEGVGGHAPAPPAWSFGGKWGTARPPDGPGPGRFNPPHDTAPTAVQFGAGREVIPGIVSGVPWAEEEERAARGEGGGGNAKFYIPQRNRMGARVYMRSRTLPIPSRCGRRQRARQEGV